MDRRQIPFSFLGQGPEPEPVVVKQKKLKVPLSIRDYCKGLSDPELEQAIKDFDEIIEDFKRRTARQLVIETDREILHGKLLDAARAEMMCSVDEGTTCPCCGGHVQRYKRSLNSGMAASLCWLVLWCRRNGNGIGICVSKVSTPKFVTANRELGKLAHWGLVEEVKAAHWIPTVKGIDFVNDRVKVPRHVFLLHNIVQSWSEEKIGIREALGDKFDYNVLMGSVDGREL